MPKNTVEEIYQALKNKLPLLCYFFKVIKNKFQMDVTKPGSGWEGPESEPSVQQKQRHWERHGWCIISQHCLEPRELEGGAAIEITPLHLTPAWASADTALRGGRQVLVPNFCIRKKKRLFTPQHAARLVPLGKN